MSIWLVTGNTKCGNSWQEIFSDKALIKPSIELTYSKIPHKLRVVVDYPPAMVFEIITDERLILIHAVKRGVNTGVTHL